MTSWTQYMYIYLQDSLKHNLPALLRSLLVYMSNAHFDWLLSQNLSQNCAQDVHSTNWNIRIFTPEFDVWAEICGVMGFWYQLSNLVCLFVCLPDILNSDVEIHNTLLLWILSRNAICNPIWIPDAVYHFVQAFYCADLSRSILGFWPDLNLSTFSALIGCLTDSDTSRTGGVAIIDVSNFDLGIGVVVKGSMSLATDSVGSRRVPEVAGKTWREWMADAMADMEGNPCVFLMVVGKAAGIWVYPWLAGITVCWCCWRMRPSCSFIINPSW